MTGQVSKPPSDPRPLDGCLSVCVCMCVFVRESFPSCWSMCVRACRLVFVIRGSMSSIKIYLSDFS
ncbi:GH10390 [Drosophila grimshawi]|uniref:GH10390 n=1 Tax=Drosophila grimshawi TaxID=7222 RepID=B4JEC8_DROGR|nr:GH10390 [Drosophila grimshawi]